MTRLIRGKAQGFHDAGWSLSKTRKHLVVTKGAVTGSVQKDLQSLGLETSLQSNQNLALILARSIPRRSLKISYIRPSNKKGRLRGQRTVDLCLYLY